MDRTLDRHSVNTNATLHLAAIRSFVGFNRGASPNLHATEEFVSTKQALLPVLDRFLEGQFGDETLLLMRQHLPPLRGSVRQILNDLDHALQGRFLEGDSNQILTWLEFGVHVEAVSFALFPESWAALNMGAGGWEVSEVFRSNVFWVHEGLRDGDKLCQLWRDYYQK